MASKPLPPTRDGFRYHYVEDDQYICDKYEHHGSDTLKRLSFTKKKSISPIVKLSENDRAPQLKLDGDFRVTGEKGYCMVRATHSINRGKFYYEIYIDKMNKEKRDENDEISAARIGWGQKYSNLQAPLGYDAYGYSYRSRFGTKFHDAKGQSYDKCGGYGQGDTIGCMIELPFGNKRDLTEKRHLPASIKNTGYIINFKRKDTQKILEEKDEPPTDMKPLIGSKISFYKNGQYLGVAFENIYEGFYYPSISLYKNCTVTVNFGQQEFRFPPPQEIDNKTGCKRLWRPAMDMGEIGTIDDLLSDLLYIVEQEQDPAGNKLEQLIKKGSMN